MIRMYKVTYKINKNDTELLTEYFCDFGEASDFIDMKVESRVESTVNYLRALSSSYDLNVLYTDAMKLFDIKSMPSHEGVSTADN